MQTGNFIRKFTLCWIIALTGFLPGCKKTTEEVEVIPYEYLVGKIAFSRMDGEIFIIDADKKTTNKVYAKDNAGIWEGSVSFSPDGQKLAYSAFYYKYAGGYQIFTMAAAGENYFQVTDPNSGNNSPHNFGPVWNYEGTKLFYINGAMNSGNVFSIMPDGTGNTKISDFEAYGKVSVSKDGNRIALAYSKGEFDIPQGIDIYNLEKDSLAKITHNDSTISAYSPVFSPDEKKIAFVQRHGFNEYGSPPYYFRIMTVNVDGTDENKVIELPFIEYITDTYLSWSPDGTRIIFNFGSGLNNDFSSHIFLVYPDGTGLVQITSHSGYDGAPSWVK
jgi:Tol biopolymer transport system component